MQAVAVIAGIVGLVWGVVIYLRGGLLAGCLVVLLAGMCFGLPFLDIELGSVSLTVDRIVWFVLIAQYAIWRLKGWADPKPPGRSELVLCGFVGAMVLSTFTADWRANGNEPATRLALFYLMPLGVYWVARQSRLSERSVLALFGCLTALGVYLAATVVAETFQVWWLVYPKYIEETMTSTSLEFIGRGRGPLLNPVGTGMLLALCLVGTLMWWPRARRPGRVAIVALSLLLCLAVFYTLTRSAWMGGMLGLAIMLAVTIPRRWRTPVLGAGLLIVVVAAVSQWQNLVAFKRDRDLSAAQTAESVHLRPILGVVAWKMFLDRPLLGCGFAQYPKESANYVADRSTSLPLEKGYGYEPHNVLFSLLTEAGLVGLGLFVILVGFWGRDAWQLWRHRSAPLWARQQGLLLLAAMGIYFVNGMFHDTSVAPMAHMTLFFLAGVTAGLRPLWQPSAVACRLPSGRLLPGANPSAPQPAG